MKMNKMIMRSDDLFGSTKRPVKEKGFSVAEESFLYRSLKIISYRSGTIVPGL